MILSSKAREAAKWLVLISLETTLATSLADFPATECTSSVPAVSTILSTQRGITIFFA